MTPAQGLGHEDQLRTLNTNNDPVQFFNADPEFPSVPQQNGGAQINAGLRTVAQAMQGMINATAGMFAANMGDNPNAQSGVAIRQLQDKGDNGTLKYSRSMEIAIQATGQLIKDAIPKVYDTERTIRVLKEDESYDMADINQKVVDNATGEIVVINDLSVGVYDVVCKAGPSYKNRQQETVEAITNLAQIDPSLMPTTAKRGYPSGRPDRRTQAGPDDSAGLDPYEAANRGRDGRNAAAADAGTRPAAAA